MEKIKMWWKEEGRFVKSNLIQSIKNLIRWFPIIWKDRNYDHTFIYEILKFKLSEQSKYLKSKDRFVSTQRQTEKIDICVRLLDKIKTDYYATECYEYSETKMNFVPINDSEFALEIDEISENYQKYFDKYPLVYKRIIQNDKYVYYNDSKSNIASNIAIYNKRRSEALLYKIIHDNIGRWWD